MAGPYAGIGIGTTAVASVGAPSLDWDFMAGAFLKAEAGVSAEAFGNSLFDYNRQWSTDTIKYLTPYILEKVSGDNQTGQSGQYLSMPVEVRVLDNANMPCRNVRVHFNFPIGESASATQYPVKGSRIPIFPLPFFQSGFCFGIYQLVKKTRL